MPTRGTGMGHCSHLPWFGAESGVSIDSYQDIYFQSPLSNLLLKKKNAGEKKKFQRSSLVKQPKPRLLRKKEKMHLPVLTELFALISIQ